MGTPAPCRPPAPPQRGVALVALLALVMLAIGWAIVAALNAAANRTAGNRNDNAAVLAQAKAALIGWMTTRAVDVDERDPGRLPCPEAPGNIGTSNEGVAAGSCAAPALGRLPWRTLGLPKLYDGSGEPLWYAVSSAWALPTTSATLTINSNSQGTLTVDARANAAVALVIAPGGPMVLTPNATQIVAGCAARTQGRGTTPPDVRDYLECASLGAAPYAFWSAAPQNTANPTHNDQVVMLTTADLIAPLEAAIAVRLQRDLAPLLADAAQGDAANAVRSAPAQNFYPFAAAWTSPADFPLDTNSPSQSPYVGALATSQGLLPLMRSRVACDAATDAACNATLPAFPSNSKPCTAGSDAHCDPATAVNWNVGGGIDTNAPRNGGLGWTVDWKDGGKVEIDIVSGAGLIGNVNCSPSDAALLDCRVRYGQNCASPPCTTAVQPTVTLAALTSTAAGRAYRRVNKTALAAYAATFASEAQFQSGAAGNGAQWLTGGQLGAARVVTQWLLPSSGSPCNNTQCGSTRIRIPNLYMEDNVALHASLRDLPASGQPDRYSWFLRNRWHEVAYVAIAAGFVPGGAGSCSSVSPVTCLQVPGLPPQDKQRALLLLAGRSLAGAARPSADLADYLDTAENRNLDAIFERRVANSTFNDRFIVVDANP